MGPMKNRKTLVKVFWYLNNVLKGIIGTIERSFKALKDLVEALASKRPLGTSLRPSRAFPRPLRILS